jgi:ribosomal protein S10
MFFILSDDSKFWHHSRCDKEISNYKSLIDIASKAGKASALKRSLNRNSTDVKQVLKSSSTDVQLTINQEPLPNNHKPITNIKIQAPQGVSLEVWESFLSQRKISKATVTETVIKSIQKEADKANWTLEQALSEIVARGWRGFKADWVIKTKDKSEKNNELISGLTRGLLGGTKNVKLLNN